MQTRWRIKGVRKLKSRVGFYIYTNGGGVAFVSGSEFSRRLLKMMLPRFYNKFHSAGRVGFDVVEALVGKYIRGISVEETREWGGEKVVFKVLKPVVLAGGQKDEAE